MILLNNRFFINENKIKTVTFNEKGEALVTFDDDIEVLYIGEEARALKEGLLAEPSGSDSIQKFKDFLSSYNPMLFMDESLNLAFTEFEKKNVR